MKITMLSLKKNVFIVLMMMVPVWFVIMKRDELFVSSGYFHDKAADRRAMWDECVRTSGNNTYTSETTNRTLSRIAVVEEDVLVELKHIQKSLDNIFFVESSCATKKLSNGIENTGDFILKRRQCCAVESTSRTNPDRRVYVLHTCPLQPGFLQRAPLYARYVLSRPNVRVVRYDIQEVFAGTPVEKLVERRGMEESSYPIEHASDIIRLTLLWRFGGFYSDMDVVTIRSLADLGTNFCGKESDTSIGNAVLAFEPKGLGYDLLTAALKHINDNFDGSRWTANGPDVVTNLILHACNATMETVLQCSAFTVFNHTIFYPVFWWDSEDLFNVALGPSLVSCITKNAYLVHVWNKQSSKSVVQVGSQQAYGLLANMFCPDVYRNCGDTF